MKYSKIIALYKKSTFQMYEGIIEKGHIKKNNKDMYHALIMAHREHLESVEIIKKKLRTLKIPVVFHCRGEKKMPKINSDHILIALGGDGTFIFASHYVKDALMIGINSAPDFSIGHFCKYNLFDKTTNLIAELDDILSEKSVITELNRLKLKINGDEVHIPIINDILIVDKNPATTTRYIIDFNGNRYHQKSSGIWISTSMGSTAAYASSGGKTFPQYNARGEKQYGFIIREIYRPEKDTLQKAMVTEKDRLEIIISMIEGYIYIDGGQKKIKVHIGDKIEIGFQEKPLKAIMK
jgi:NAD+ kinase